MIQAQELVIEEAVVVEEAAVVEVAAFGEAVHFEAVQEAAADVEPFEEAIFEVASAGESGSPVDPPDPQYSDLELGTSGPAM